MVRSDSSQRRSKSAGSLAPIVTGATALLASGASLLLSIASGAPLAWTLPICLALSLASVAIVSAATPASVRAVVRRRALAGFAAGLAATAAYDAVRWSIVWSLDLSINPFEAFRWFGWSLGGRELSEPAAFGIGVLFHSLNGVMFAGAYGVLAAGRRWFWGVGWALGLEVLMLVAYPAWLNLAGVMEEFTLVSFTGHVAYGIVLGLAGSQLR